MSLLSVSGAGFVWVAASLVCWRSIQAQMALVSQVLMSDRFHVY